MFHAESYKDQLEFKKFKIHFYVVLGKNEEDVWSLVKIVSITPDALFKVILQNYRYSVVWENNVLFDFTIFDFLLMNLNYLITATKILGDLIKYQIQDKTSYIIGYGHIKRFLDGYFAHLALTNIDLSIAFNRMSKVPKGFIERENKH